MYVVSPELRSLTWVDGIWLILRKLEAILKSHGLEEVAAQDQSFDPLVHQAIAQVEGEEGKVVSVVQKGYTLQKRLIRPAMVTVGGAPALDGAETSGTAQPDAGSEAKGEETQPQP